MIRRLLATVTLLVAAQARGRRCARAPELPAALHGLSRRDGRGLEGQVPSMHGTLAMLSRTPEGRYYVLRVPGVTQSTLSDETSPRFSTGRYATFSDARRRARIGAAVHCRGNRRSPAGSRCSTWRRHASTRSALGSLRGRYLHRHGGRGASASAFSGLERASTSRRRARLSRCADRERRQLHRKRG